jgi:hypothetical protein
LIVVGFNWYVHTPSLEYAIWFHLLEFKNINYEIVTWVMDISFCEQFMNIYKYIIIFP